jgi:D-sedoheptulose 7-phosphate isomerase
MQQIIKKEIEQVAANFARLAPLYPAIEKAALACIGAIKSGHKVLWCGNGGSASQCQHLAAELVGRYHFDRPAMNSLSLTVDTSALTAIGNDYGYEQVFARQLQGVGAKGDVLAGLSTSGNSPNVVLAFEQARKMGIARIAFTGEKPSKMADLADITLAVPSAISNNIQEMHLAIGHIICGLIEEAIYGKRK